VGNAQLSHGSCWVGAFAVSASGSKVSYQKVQPAGTCTEYNMHAVQLLRRNARGVLDNFVQLAAAGGRRIRKLCARFSIHTKDSCTHTRTLSLTSAGFLGFQCALIFSNTRISFSRMRLVMQARSLLHVLLPKSFGVAEPVRVADATKQTRLAGQDDKDGMQGTRSLCQPTTKNPQPTALDGQGQREEPVVRVSARCRGPRGCQDSVDQPPRITGCTLRGLISSLASFEVGV